MPVSSPLIDPRYLQPCIRPDGQIDIDSLLLFKQWIDAYRECAEGKQVLIDYIHVIEKTRE